MTNSGSTSIAFFIVLETEFDPFFSLGNNKVNHGLKYGMNLLQNWRKSFQEDYKFMHYNLKQKGQRSKNWSTEASFPIDADKSAPSVNQKLD